MLRTKPDKPETLTDRIALLIKHTGGTMPLVVIVQSDVEKQEAEKLLARSKSKATKLITVKLFKDLEEWKKQITTKRNQPQTT